MEQEVRNEEDIFKDLEKLCKSVGYFHAIAFFCFRDNTIKYTDRISSEDLLDSISIERLSRAEIQTLIGLACKGMVDIDIPSPYIFQEYIDKTEVLLTELHEAIFRPIVQSYIQAKESNSYPNPFKNGYALREIIFYGGESAYNFQYRDLSLLKYKNDDDWFLEKKGYSILQAISIVTAINRIQNHKINNLKLRMEKLNPEDWTAFPAYTFTVEEVLSESNINEKTTRALIESFIVPLENEINIDKFSKLDDFNPLNAYPIIKLNKTEYLLFQDYSLVEALYETPFFWFNDDLSYRDKARKNRGDFLEKFSEDRLKLVFGQNRVFTNIDIYKDKKTKVSEIDVLVIFANRAIILQAKSKKLTIEARKGNDNSLQNDFKKAIQDSYDQALKCAEVLNDKNYRLIDSEGRELNIPRNYKEIYPICIISDHYPALSFQVNQFLKYRTSETIMPPFIMDVFLLDVLTEMLQSPLHFLSYINRRVCYGEKISSGHELIVLAYHLQGNLWIEDDYSNVILCDDISVDLDLAMSARRDNTPSLDTPVGILTKYRETPFGQLIDDINKLEDSGTIDLGFMLWTLCGDTIEQLNDGISQIASLYKKDRIHHDFTIGVSEGATGLCIHCNNDTNILAMDRLADHCLRRKYTQKAKTWFGIIINPDNSRMKFVLSLNYDWVQSDELDILTKDMNKSQFFNEKN